MWPSLRSAKVDNVVFSLFYRCTVLILVAFSFVVTCRLLFGDSFTCSSYDDSRSINVYCYAHSPFIVISAMSKGSHQEVVYPGVTSKVTKEDQVVHMPYYRWVNLFFLVSAVLFYLPHLLWKICEGGLVTRITAKVNNSSISEEERKKAIIEIAKYILTTRGGHLPYTCAYVFSEAMNWLVGVLLTVWLAAFFRVDMFFTSDEFKMESWDDFFAFNFPSVAQCQFNRYGSSGDVQLHYVVCFLPLNDLYGYMFLFLYAWFIMLCVLSALVFPYGILGLMLPPLRLLLFRLRSDTTDQTSLNFLNAHLSFGDWFLLTRLQKNLLAHDLTKLLIYLQQNFNENPLDLEMNDLGKLT